MQASELSHALVPVAGQEEYVRQRFWKKVRRTLGRVPFLDRAVAAYYAAIDPQTPLRAKAVLMAALAYFVMPIDLVPDILAGIGFSDDAAVLMLAIQALAPHIKPHHIDRARETLERDIPAED